MIKQKLIPELRFPEFKNEGEWEEKTLIDICHITNGKANAQDHVENGKYPLFDRSEVIKASNEFVFDSEAVIIPGEGMRFIPKYYEGKFNLHQRAYALKDFKCSGQFIYYSMHHRSALISQKAVQSTVLSLRLPILQRFPLEIPKNPKEQQRIASCLSSLDEVIAAHSQKLDLLTDHKKGLMQNLFPQSSLNCDSSDSNDENDFNIPKLRFPEFKNQGNHKNHKNQGSDNGEWVEKKLGEIAIFLKGKGISKSDIVENGILPCIRYGELYTHYKETIDAIKSYTNLSSDELVLSKADDVIIPASGETQIDIATAACVLKSGIALGGDLNIIRSKIDGIFLAYYLNSAKKTDIAQLAQGISVVHLYPSQLQTLSISFPKNPKEQQRIASCLSSLDALIIAQAEKIEQLKLHKKGLMQGLFPKMSEL